MLRWSTIILVLAIVLAVLGFGGLVASAVAGILKILFVIALVIFLASLFIGRRRVM